MALKESAEKVYKALNGVFCIYKPHMAPIRQVMWSLQHNTCTQLNKMPGRPLRKNVIFQEGIAGSNLPSVTTVPDLADHPLVIGERYQPEDFPFHYVDALKSFSSGVQLVGLGVDSGSAFMRRISSAKFLRVYLINARLGIATDNCQINGNIRIQTTFHHVTQHKLDKTIAAMQAGHQRNMFLAAGVDLQDQEAYNLAASGIIRPKHKHAGPVVYGMKCVEFDPPNFTLEIHATNEDCKFLSVLVHQLGVLMKTTATVTQLRRIRYGPFSLSHALLRKHWLPTDIVDNMKLCKPLLTDDMLKYRTTFESRNVRYQSLESDDQDWVRGDGEQLYDDHEVEVEPLSES